jgi:fibronectin-binding autotransporter adhesin
LSGSGNCAGEVTVKADGAIAPGRTVGVLTVGTLVLDHDDSRLVFDLDRPDLVGPPDNDLLIVAGDLVLDGKLTVNRGPNIGPGRYRLISYQGRLVSNNILSAVDGNIDTSVPGIVDLVVPPPPPVPALPRWGPFLMGLLLVLGGALGLPRRAGAGGSRPPPSA